MKRLGTIKNVMRDGSILIKASLEAEPGTTIYDARGEKLGYVSRVFGPVKEPYMTLKPDAQAKTLNLLESVAYYDPDGSEGGRKRG